MIDERGEGRRRFRKAMNRTIKAGICSLSIVCRDIGYKIAWWGIFDVKLEREAEVDGRLRRCQAFLITGGNNQVTAPPLLRITMNTRSRKRACEKSISHSEPTQPMSETCKNPIQCQMLVKQRKMILLIQHKHSASVAIDNEAARTLPALNEARRRTS